MLADRVVLATGEYRARRTRKEHRLHRDSGALQRLEKSAQNRRLSLHAGCARPHETCPRAPGHLPGSPIAFHPACNPAQRFLSLLRR